MERLTSWLKEQYNNYYFKIRTYDKQYLKKDLYLYGVECLYKNEDGEIETDVKYFLLSNEKAINELLNRARGFDCNSSANNGIGLHNYYIDGYIIKFNDYYQSLRY